MLGFDFVLGGGCFMLNLLTVVQSDKSGLLLNYFHVPRGRGGGLGGQWEEVSEGFLLQANLCECCSQRGLMKCIQGNMTMWVTSRTRSRKWGADPRSLCSRRKLIGRTGAIVRDETLSGRAWRTLSLHVSHLAHFIFFDMQTLLSHPHSKTVSQAAKGGRCDDSNPISIWTITQPSGLAVHLFQFDWIGESRLEKPPAQPLYSGHPAQAGDWWARSISAGSSCSGLNMLTPLKMARDPSSKWITRCSPAIPLVSCSSSACVLVSLPPAYKCCLIVCFDVWPRVRGMNGNSPHLPLSHRTFHHYH